MRALCAAPPTHGYDMSAGPLKMSAWIVASALSNSGVAEVA